MDSLLAQIKTTYGYETDVEESQTFFMFYESDKLN